MAKGTAKRKLPLSTPRPKAPNSIKIPCLTVNQGQNELVFFKVNAKDLWAFVEINQRDTNKNTGYQRALSESRVSSVRKYIENGNTIPISILIALDDRTKFDRNNQMLEIPNVPNAGWVIDGQHRLAGANAADVDIELAVIAFLAVSEQEQIKQFVVINQEAKGVPRSLYYDLLRHLPPDKSETDLAKERAVDIANDLKKTENSPFHARIVISSPQLGEISLNNFVRKVYPLLGKNGFFKEYTINEQTRILDNYFRAFKNAFPQYFEYASPIFYKTIGFGALMNALPTIFQITLKIHKGFTVSDISNVLDVIGDFDFSTWNSHGTGTQAENQASADLIIHLQTRLENTASEDSTTLRL